MKPLHKLLVALLASLLTSALVVGCGTDDTGEEGIDANAEEGDNDEVSEFEAAHLLVDVNPQRFTYAVGTHITPLATVYDESWSEMADVDVQWSFEPAEAVEAQGSQWSVQKAGVITIHGCVVDPDGELTEICGSKNITSAIGTDRIVIESPSPGQHFHGTEDATIPVQGVVDPAMKVEVVDINGGAVPVDEEGRFSHEITPKFGVNTITVRAFDGVNADDAMTAVGVMWAPTYRPATIDDESGQLGFDIDEAILLSLGQNFLDDGEPYTVISESQILTKDLADILLLVLEFADINSEIPDPVVDSSSLYLSVPDVAIKEPRIEIDATTEGIEIYAQIGDLVAETAGFMELSDTTIDLTGSISAALSLYAELEIEKMSLDEPFHVELTDFEVAVEHATPNFDSDEANAIFELADSVLRDNLEEILLDGVDLSFVESLPELLLDLFESLDQVVAGQQFELDLDLGDPLTLHFDGGIEQFTPIHGRALEGFISATLRVDGHPHFVDNPGVVDVDVEPANSPFFAHRRVQLGLNLALINGIFHSLWNAGLLELDITELVPDSVSGLIDEGYASGLLPPVASAPTDDSAHDILLHLGQLELELDWLDQLDRFGAELVVGADLTVMNDEVSISIGEDPEIHIWLIESSEETPLMSAEELRHLIRSALWPEIEGAIGDGLGFALPIPGVESLAEYAPEMAGMTLDVRMTRPLDLRQGFLMIDAAIEGELFLP